jgi:flagellar FliL protein
MADPEPPQDEAPNRRSKLPFLIGLVLMLGLGGGGFYAMYTGMILGGNGHGEEADHTTVEALPDIAFVPLEPIVVSLGTEPGGRYLHFTAQVEVEKQYEPDLVHLLPRVVDVLNGYLRAVEVRDLEDPTALVRLRAQMLRRVQMVAGEGRVRDVLVTEFVIN